MKIEGIKVERGIKIKGAGLTQEEKKIIENAMSKIKYGRRKNKQPPLPYLIELK